MKRQIWIVYSAGDCGSQCHMYLTEREAQMSRINFWFGEEKDDPEQREKAISLLNAGDKESLEQIFDQRKDRIAEVDWCEIVAFEVEVEDRSRALALIHECKEVAKDLLDCAEWSTGGDRTLNLLSHKAQTLLNAVAAYGGDDSVLPTYEMTDQPPTCPKCGLRACIEEPSYTFNHPYEVCQCPGRECNYRFRTEPNAIAEAETDKPLSDA